MTREESAEWQYRYQERLGILCEDRAPDSEQERLARAEADQWLKESRGELFV